MSAPAKAQFRWSPAPPSPGCAEAAVTPGESAAALTSLPLSPSAKAHVRRSPAPRSPATGPGCAGAAVTPEESSVALTSLPLDSRSTSQTRRSTSQSPRSTSLRSQQPKQSSSSESLARMALPKLVTIPNLELYTCCLLSRLVNSVVYCHLLIMFFRRWKQVDCGSTDCQVSRGFSGLKHFGFSCKHLGCGSGCILNKYHFVYAGLLFLEKNDIHRKERDVALSNSYNRKGLG